MPKALHRRPGMQSPILIIARDGVVIKGQSAKLLVVFTLQIVPTNHKQVRKHLERIYDQTDAAAMAMVDHLHRDGLNRQLKLACHEEHLHIETKTTDG